MLNRALILTACLLLAGCRETAPNDGKLHVVATTTLLTDAVKRVGGEFVHVECLMGPGIDPHRYTATPGDMRKLSGADLILFHGLHLEGKMDDVLSKKPPRKAVAVCERIDAKKLRTGEHGADGAHDPHVWMDPALWVEVVHSVRDELAVADPAHRDEYFANAGQFVVDIRVMDDMNRKLFSGLPKERRILVTSHDAFAYFGAAYGLEVRGLQGISTVAETSTKDVEELATYLGSQRVPAVFTETSVPPKGLEAVLDSVKKKYHHHVKLVGGDDALYSDALGEPGTPGETYIGMMRHNVSVIVNGLK